MMKILNLAIAFCVSLTFFSTGVYASDDSRIRAFGDAEWIGGGEEDMTLYAQYLTVFRLVWTAEGDGWLKFGGGDERFTNAFRNVWHIENEPDSVFILVETDCEKGEIRVSRNGMDRHGRQSRTLKAEGLKEQGRHNIEVAVAFGTADLKVDGSKIGTVNLNPARGAIDKSLGLSGDFASYPCLGNVTCSANVADVELRNYRSPGNVIAQATINNTPDPKGEGRGGASIFENRSSLQLRTAFKAAKPLEKATLTITSRGIYDAYINGTLVNNDWFFCPGFTQYDRTQLYQTYDITSLLKEGGNRIEVSLGEGWWSGAATYSAQNWNFYGDRQSLLARVSLLYIDGTTQDIVTNPDTWQCCSDGARLYSSMFNGEVRDISRPLFDENSAWHKAVAVPTQGTTVEGEDYSNVEYMLQRDTPVHPIDTLTAISCTEVRPKVFVYDMGQNIAGVVDLNPKAPPQPSPLGEGVIRIRYSEVLYPDLEKFGDLQGEMLTENYRAAISQDILLLSPSPKGEGWGGASATFRHTLHGFRYVEITGIDEPLPLSDVKAVALSSLDGITAHYECSDSLVNRLWNNILWSARGNFVSIPTDCPQRNERMGWSGDISVFSHTATYLSDVEEFLKRHLRTMRDTQSEAGQFTDVAPMRGEGFGGLLWGSAGITVAWECYRQWGNLELLREHYESMARYISFIQKEYMERPVLGDSVARPTLLVQHREWGDLGDWLSPVYDNDNDDKSLLWECYYIYDLDIMSKVSALLGRKDEAAEYAKLRDERKAFFRQTYLSPDDFHTIWSAFDKGKQGQTVGTQTSYILPLAFDICEGEERKALENHLIKLIEENDYHLMVGFIGVPWIGETLSKIGRTDLIYRILTCTEYPSWLYPVCQGATTIWERLNAYVKGEGYPAGNGMNSFNHYSFGSVGSWLIERSLGISVAQPPVPNGSAVGITIAPTPDPTGRITWAKGHYNSRQGRIESGWRRLPNGKTEYTFSIPKGITATVSLPGTKPKKYKAGRYSISR